MLVSGSDRVEVYHKQLFEKHAWASESEAFKP